MADKVDKVDEQGDILEQIASQLAKAASDKKNRSAILKEVESTLSKITIADAQELADSPAIQSFLSLMGVNDLKPGEVKNKGTLAERVRDWTENDMRQFPYIEIEPRETITVTFNGLQFQLIDGVKQSYPEPVVAIYEGHRNAIKQGEIHENYRQGFSNQAPHPNWMTDSTSKVRAFSQMGPVPDIRKRGVGPIAIDDGGNESA